MLDLRALAALVLLAAALPAQAQENAPPPSTTQTCPVDTTVDKDTGKPRTGVAVCHEGHSGSIGVSVTGKELDHFLKYPFGQSDKSVAKQIGRAVEDAFRFRF